MQCGAKENRIAGIALLSASEIYVHLNFSLFLFKILRTHCWSFFSNVFCWCQEKSRPCVVRTNYYKNCSRTQSQRSLWKHKIKSRKMDISTRSMAMCTVGWLVIFWYHLWNKLGLSDASGVFSGTWSTTKNVSVLQIKKNINSWRRFK